MDDLIREAIRQAIASVLLDDDIDLNEKELEEVKQKVKKLGGDSNDRMGRLFN